MKNIFIKKNILIGAVIVGLLGGFSFYKSIDANSEEKEDVVVTEYTVQKSNLSIEYVGDGQLEIPTVNLDFEITGKLEDLFVEPGSAVKKGDIIATLDDTDYGNKAETSKRQYEQALLKYEQAKEQKELNLIAEKEKLDNLKYALDTLKVEYEPMTKMKEYYPASEIEKKRIEYEKAKLAHENQLKRYNTLSNTNLDLEMEQVAIKQAELNLKIAEDDLRNTVLESPIDGKVLYTSYKPGETVVEVTKDEDTTTADSTHVVVLSDSGSMEVIVPVSEIDLSNIEIDQNVNLEFEAFLNKSFQGKVTYIEELPKIDSSGLVTYDVNIRLNENNDKLKSGMTCTAAFILKERKNVITIPNKAVYIKDKKQYVKVKKEDGTVEERKISTGLTDGKSVEVTKGIEIGEIILVEK
ncbi:efflux RND transporter periplasmic adaptor subunit [Anaeromicrobium sediminis]|uniref:efflux RND transporter periplasmic adaptor subunit n=1 Tax=Anaeromicrobium sediminis TaxID=1478221 RepID=UPI0015953466|nr:efflux RND transporter periplasmic adaptor subunit [Anaeromicrobium sediminis]